MIRITMIFGEDAVKKYDESGELPSEEWLMDNGGVVDEKEFKTLEEYNAYIAGLNDGDGWNDYQIIRHEDETEGADTPGEEAIWMRLGAMVTGKREEIEKILEGDADTLVRLLAQGKFEINGETHIPATVIEEYNKEHQTGFKEKDMDFHLS